MRLILSLTILIVSFGVYAQTYKQALAAAYHCESDSCFSRKLEEAKPHLTSDTARAFVDYIKYFYLIKTDRLDSADGYYKKARFFDKKIKNWPIYFNTLDARINTLESRGKFDQAVLELKEGINEAKELNELIEQARLHNMLSYIYHNMGMHREGVEQGKKTILMLDTTTQFYEVLMSGVNAVGINFDDWEMPDSALFYHYQNIRIGLDKTTTIAASSTLNNIGNTYMKKNDLDSAQKYFQESLVLAQESQQKSTLATIFNNLGDIALKKGKFDIAKPLLDSALYYAEADDYSPLEKRRDVYQTLYRYYEQIGDMANAFLYQGKYITYRDSMHNLEQIEQLKDLELKATTAQKDKEIAQGDLKVKNRNTWIGAIAGLLLLALAFVRQLYLKRQQVAQQAQLKLQEERLRISRDLHDNIGAELTYISSVIDQKTFGMKDPEEKREYERLSDSSRSAMAQLRETIWAIKTEEITIEKFATKLNELSRKYSEGLGVKLSIAQSGENYLLPPAKVINLFRVCQEAINNAIKYSSCTEIRIELNAESNQLNMSIADDGNGFDTESTKTGYGLQNMRERIEEIGGIYDIKSISSEGTRISVSLPLKDY